MILPAVEAKRSIATLRLLGGHVALDLANTVAARRGGEEEDVLREPPDLLTWAARAGAAGEAELAEMRAAIAADPAGAAEALHGARQLREALYRIFSTHAEGGAPARTDLDLLQDLAGQAARVLRRREGGFSWDWAPGRDPRDLVRRVAHAAAELLVDARLPRVRECHGHHCGWLFLDTSRGGQRRWCAEEDCGVTERVRRHRARRSPGGA